ncbi:MAG TPA: alpha/beta hydrolase [Myxococcota bacterium]|jgi:pimeloyl-ACP methyl ester carboxylesterase
MRRVLLVLVLGIAAAIALPPLWFRVFPVKTPQLAAPETFVALASGPRMHAIVRGEGPPVVLVHGLPGLASDWRATTELLAGHGRHVIAIDRLGYGHSDARDGDDFTFEANARELRELLDALDLTDVTVVGWSYGGGTAMVAARQQAAAAETPRIARIVLVGSVGPSSAPSGPPAIIRVLFSRPVLRWMRMVPPLVRELQRTSAAAAFSGQAQPDWFLPELAANLAQPKTQLAYAGEGAQMPRDPVPDTTGLELPILVIQGADDRFVPAAVGRALAHNNPGAELVEVEGGSHMLPVTHAALLADRIASFSAPPPAAEPAAPPGADAGAPDERPEHWMDVVAAKWPIGV